MNILSLFDGIRCGMLATERAGIEVDGYFASEIDDYAIKIANKNYPNATNLGDVTLHENWNLPRIDLLIGGSPCQGLSIANTNRKNLEDIRSVLFYKYVEVLEKHKPKYFLLENVKMDEESENEFTRLLGVKPIEINSLLVSAQNRKRLYWTNIPNVNMPIDKKILLSDIIDDSIPFTESYEKYNHRLTKNYVQFDVSGKGYNSQQDRAYYIDGKFSTFPNARAITKRKITDKKGYYRDLTLNECETLQTLPSGYTTLEDGFSLNKSLSAIGNGWTVDVIAHILSFIPD